MSSINAFTIILTNQIQYNNNDLHLQAGVGIDTDDQTKFKFAGEKQLNSLVEWAKHIPHFAELNIDDQV